MDKYRRRPPMEGFSRPGSLGGEAHDNDDSVEGHIMDDDRTQDGSSSYLKRADDEDTEGHAGSIARRADDDDTEGHAGWLKASDDDDTEGHAKLK